jgi:hypothetical protein
LDLSVISRRSDRIIFTFALLLLSFSSARAAQLAPMDVIRVDARGKEAGDTPAATTDRALKVVINEKGKTPLSLLVESTPADLLEKHGRFAVRTSSILKLPISRGKTGKVTLTLKRAGEAAPVYSLAATVASEPFAIIYGFDGRPMTLTSDDTLSVLGSGGSRSLRLVPPPANGLPCQVSIQTVGSDGTVYSMVRAQVAAPLWEMRFDWVDANELGSRTTRDDLTGSPTPRRGQVLMIGDIRSSYQCR